MRYHPIQYSRRTEAKVSQKLGAFIHSPIQGVWAGITTSTCDGLPLIGALPGRDDLLICAGYGEEEATLGLRGAETIARLLIDGEDPAYPSFFNIRRLLF